MDDIVTVFREREARAAFPGMREEKKRAKKEKKEKKGS